MKSYRSQVEASALWAAYGDALGFMTELADEEKGVRWRTGVSKIEHTQEWRRKIGGFNGTVINFPAGSYSDDTQLRLATCRAISSDGFFDVEAFAKIELPVWSCYALGAGRGTKDAVSNLVKKNVRWNANFFKGSKGARSYTESGGNGAAMRIQPHVWCATNKAPFSEIAKQVVRNTIVTHGHPHAIIGALFHALCLHETLINADIPEPQVWEPLIEDASQYCLDSIFEDQDIASSWLYEWEKRAEKPFQREVEIVLAECKVIIRLVKECIVDSNSYEQIATNVGAADPMKRGMGTLTAILALVMAHLKKDQPLQALLTTANCLGTDTDTIATMAGALLGAVNADSSSLEIQDQSLIREEANKLVDIHDGKKARKFQYPSLLTWQPPIRITDAVFKMKDSYLIPGLGLISFDEKITSSNANAWHWGKLTMGQTVLVKLPNELPEYRIEEMDVPLRPYVNTTTESGRKQMKSSNQQFSLLSEPHYPSTQEIVNPTNSEVLDANSAFNLARESGFNAKVIGELLIRLSSNKSYAAESSASFAALISKALIERKKKYG